MSHFIHFFLYPSLLSQDECSRFGCETAGGKMDRTLWSRGGGGVESFIRILDVRKYLIINSRSLVVRPDRKQKGTLPSPRPTKQSFILRENIKPIHKCPYHVHLGLTLGGKKPKTGSRSPSFSAELVILSPRSHSKGSKVTPLHLPLMRSAKALNET